MIRPNWLAVAGLALAVRLAAQQPPPHAPPPPPATLDVFLDCQTFYGCDADHVTREIPYVNWMRERQDADVHVLVTSQQTGGGGQEITLAFIGLGRFEGEADTLVHIASNTDTQAEMRDGVTRLVKLGLTRFLAKTPVAPSLDVTFRPPSGPPVASAATPGQDPWDFWTFRVRVGGYLSGERQQNYRSFNGQVSANRTTKSLKTSLSLYGNTSRSAYTLSDSEYVSTTESYSANALTAWSVSPHWSVGATATGSRSTYNNLDLSVAGGPAIEYDLFPYDQSTRKIVTFMYSVELASFNYQDTTVTGKLSEILPRHKLEIGATVQQPWGQVFGSVTGTQYLHDLSAHRIETYAGATLRLIRGLEFSMYGGFDRIKDQFGLPAAGLTDEEILLQRRALETDYQFYINFSLSFRFGSKFANVVNPRMGGGSGGMIIMM